MFWANALIILFFGTAGPFGLAIDNILYKNRKKILPMKVATEILIIL